MDGSESDSKGALSDIMALLRGSHDIDFRRYKGSTIRRRVERRASPHTLSQYFERLREDATELERLYRDLLIPVTSFFRDAEAFDALRTHLKSDDEGIFRAWSVGCSSGQEAYSLAITLAEHVGDVDRIRVFATDVDERRLQTASRGVYSTDELAPIDERLRDKYFEVCERGWRVTSKLRQRIVFAPHDICSDPPFSRVDLICCRNLLIYLRPREQLRVLQRFYDALNERGLLFLGPSESLTDVESAFDTLDARWKLFEKLHNWRLSTSDFVIRGVDGATRVARPRRDPMTTLEDATDFIVTQAHGITPRMVPASRVHDVLRSELSPETYGRVEAAISALFEVQESSDSAAPPDAAEPQEVQRLHDELVLARARLERVTHLAERSREDHQATNEELVASNEELQTTNEELQSVNEELQTVNTDYQEKNLQLADLSKDLEQVLRSTELGIIFLDAGRCIRRYTEVATQVFQLLPQDIGRPIDHIRHNLDGIDIDSLIEGVLENQEREERTATSRGRDMIVRVSPYQDGSEEASGVVVTFVDVTEHRKASRRALRLEGELKTMLESSPITMALLDSELKFRWANGSALALMGLDENRDVRGESLYELSPLSKTRSAVFDQVLSGTALERRIDYGDRVREVRYQPVRERGEIVGVGVFSMDVTDRERWSQEAAMHSSTLQNVPLGVLVYRIEGDPADANSWTVEFGNRTALDPVNETHETVAGRSILDVYPNVVEVGTFARLHAAYRKGVPDTQAFTWGDHRVSPTTYRLWTTPFGTDRLIVIFNDITNEIRLHQENAASQRVAAVEQIAGGIAHDLNNMLGTVLMTGRALAAELEGHEGAKEDLAAITTMTNRAADLVARLLDFSRQRPVKPEVVAIHGLVHSLLPMLQRVLGTEHRLVVGTLEGAVFIDPKALEQAIVNLAANARHAMEKGGELHISSRLVDSPDVNDIPYLGPHVVIDIRDTGCGMPEEVLARCFEPFYTTRQRSSGSGMGLAMVEGLVRQAEGAITAESIIGEGTTFRMVLPARDPVKKERGSDDLRPLATTPCTVLLVDDEKLLRRAIARSLKRAGYSVLEAGSGMAAMELFERHDVDVLVTDVLMPEMNGPTLAEHLCARQPDLPVVFVSGYAGHAAVRDGMFAHFERLQKPFDPEELLAAIGRVRANLEPITDV